MVQVIDEATRIVMRQVCAQAFRCLDHGVTANAEKVLERRYLSKDREGVLQEDVDGMFHRVAHDLSLAELEHGATEEERAEVEDGFYQVMRSLDYLPNSPTLMNAGRELQQLSACFVLPVEDSIDGIFDSVKATAIIHKSGGGTGFAFSRLRMAGDVVGSTGGVASGPVSFIHAFDAATDVVKQGGTRRGANMGILRVDHPDVREFILAKQDGTRLTNFNISVGITDDFMAAVENEALYDLINPRTGKIAGQLDAREVWNLLIEAAWASGDPGVVFLDQINRFNPNPHLGEIESTNPCWSGDTRVWTAHGPRTFRELAEDGEADVRVLSEDEQGQMEFQWMRRPHLTQRQVATVVVTIEASKRRWAGERTRLTLTPDHCLYLADRTQVLARDLQVGDSLASVYRSPANQKGYLRLNNGIEGPMEHWVAVASRVGRRPNYPAEHTDHINENKADNRPENLQILPALVHNASNMWGAQNPTIRRGPINPSQSRPGSENGRYKHGVDREQAVADYAAGMSAAKVGLKHGIDRHLVTELARAQGYATGPGRLQRDRVVNHTVVSVEPGPVVDVYNGVVDDTHRYYVMAGTDHAVLSANCGEQPLMPYESCNLGSLNLAQMVRHGALGAYIEWGHIARVVQTAVHMLDNVIDRNNYPMAEIGEMSRKTHRIGLGVMGFADMLIQLGISYDSEEALETAGEISGFILQSAYSASTKLAGKRGRYPAWEGSVYKRDGIVMRHTAPTTIAPTGTISIIAGVSSGIEPLFALSYVRNVMDNTRLVEGNKYFEAVAREAGFYSPELMERVAETGSLRDVEVPDWVRSLFRMSHEISPEWHVRMQAAFQRHTDNAVSKTINFPHDATVADVDSAYRLAHQLGCKGITIYRDGSKATQVLSVGTRSTESAVRPIRLEGFTERIRTGHGNMYVTVNSTPDGQPFEVFGTLGKVGGCGAAYIEAITRLASLCMQQGVPLFDIVRQLQGIICCPTWDDGVMVGSSPDALAIVLRRVLDQEQHPEPVKLFDVGWLTAPKLTCPECGGSKVEAKEGCRVCPDCGWNACE